MKTSIWNRI